jgi:hypothetical protein
MINERTSWSERLCLFTNHIIFVRLLACFSRSAEAKIVSIPAMPLYSRWKLLAFNICAATKSSKVSRLLALQWDGYCLITVAVWYKRSVSLSISCCVGKKICGSETKNGRRNKVLNLRRMPFDVL